MDDFESLAHHLGVRIEHWGHLRHGRWGDYSHRRRRVRVLWDLDPIQHRCTVFHELGHAHYGHRGTSPRQELEADAWAARRLIRPDCWRDAAAAYDDVLTVAAELQVLPRLVEVYAVHLASHPAVRADISWQ